MSNFTNRKRLSEEDLGEIVNNGEETEFSDDNSQSYDSGSSSEIINRPISFINEENDYSDNRHKTADG